MAENRQELLPTARQLWEEGSPSKLTGWPSPSRFGVDSTSSQDRPALASLQLQGASEGMDLFSLSLARYGAPPPPPRFGPPIAVQEFGPPLPVAAEERPSPRSSTSPSLVPKRPTSPVVYQPAKRTKSTPSSRSASPFLSPFAEAPAAPPPPNPSQPFFTPFYRPFEPTPDPDPASRLPPLDTLDGPALDCYPPPPSTFSEVGPLPVASGAPKDSPAALTSAWGREVVETDISGGESLQQRLEYIKGELTPVQRGGGLAIADARRREQSLVRALQRPRSLVLASLSPLRRRRAEVALKDWVSLHPSQLRAGH